jgi:alditol oxidase
MDKRTFVKLSSAVVANALLWPLAACTSQRTNQQKNSMTPLKNWAQNLTYSTTNIHQPTTRDEIVKIVRSCQKVRALGSRHCFNSIADSNANLISTANLNEIHALDEAAAKVTVGAGIRYGELCEYLHKHGFALPNLASLPHISIAGACATATHGSGVTNGNLATTVSAVEMVTGAGDVILLSREKDPEIFNGVAVNLGALGVVTRVTLDLVEAFDVEQRVYLDLPLAQLAGNFDAIMSAGYSVSLFTDWQTELVNQVWIKNVVRDPSQPEHVPDFFGARAAKESVHPIIELSAVNCTQQMGVRGPWYDRLPHFRMGFTPSSGDELQAEYFVPRANAVKAIHAVAELRNQLKSYLMISEIRTIAADDLWMSPAYHQDSVAFHFTLKQDITGVAGLLPLGASCSASRQPHSQHVTKG